MNTNIFTGELAQVRTKKKNFLSKWSECCGLYLLQDLCNLSNGAVMSETIDSSTFPEFCGNPAIRCRTAIRWDGSRKGHAWHFGYKAREMPLCATGRAGKIKYRISRRLSQFRK